MMRDKMRNISLFTSTPSQNIDQFITSPSPYHPKLKIYIILIFTCGLSIEDEDWEEERRRVLDCLQKCRVVVEAETVSEPQDRGLSCGTHGASLNYRRHEHRFRGWAVR